MANGRGGYRPGAGRKPKALLYEEQVRAVEEKMARMLPKLADKLFEMAMEGDIRATRYLMDRILGRVPTLKASPSTDRTMPYSEREFRSEILEQNLNLCEDELRLDQRVEDMFEYEGDDEEFVAPGRSAPCPNNGVADCGLVPAGQVVAPGRSAPVPNNGVADCGLVPAGQVVAPGRSAPVPNNGVADCGLVPAGQVVAPGRSAPVPNNGVADCGSVPVGQARGNVDACDDYVDTLDSTTLRFMPSDGPNDPDRTWYYPS